MSVVAENAGLAKAMRLIMDARVAVMIESSVGSPVHGKLCRISRYLEQQQQSILNLFDE